MGGMKCPIQLELEIQLNQHLGWQGRVAGAGWESECK